MRLALAITIAAACGRDRGDHPAPAPAPAPTATSPDVVADPEPQAATHELALATCPRVDRPVYFTIEKAGKISHILGTRHFGVGIDRFPQAIVDDLRRSRIAVFETAPGDDVGVTDSPDSLPDLLGQPAWTHLRELIGSDRSASLEHMAPMYAALMAPMLYEDLSDHLDDELAKIAIDAKIATSGLESNLFQDQILHQVFDANVARAIIMSIASRDEIKADTVRELGAYCHGDPGTGGFDAPTRRFFQAAGYDNARIAQLEDQLVFARTASWVPKLAPLFAKGDAFIAVGGDHLVGDRGLIALLAKAGYTVAPVNRVPLPR